MAEEDEFEVNADITDGIESDFDDLEEAGLGVDQPPPSGSFLARRRFLIISVVVGAVFLLGAFLFGLRLLGSKKEPAPVPGIAMVTQSKEAGAKAALEKKKKEAKKKKKKKIKYVKLFGQLEGIELASVLKELSFAGIPFNTFQTGKKYDVLVGQDYQDEARNLLAIKGLPSGAVKGYQLLDNTQTLGVTEFDKRIRFLRALSGELEKAIVQFDVIEDAKVQIVLPEQRLFAVAQPPVTSAILIRKVPGLELGDQVVFAIIQLVSNAVENLQPENVSVIDTQGHVLSEGIFERMAARRASDIRGEVSEGDKKEEDVLDVGVSAGPIGRPVIPDYQRMQRWFDIKRTLEKDLERKAMKQLMGILPIGTYKVMVTSDIGPIEDGAVLDVKRLMISIVVDNLSDEVYLDADTKRRIFSTVAASIGYVRGRDTIQLSKADFALLTAAERQELENLKKGGFLKWSLFSVLGASFLGGMFYLGRFYIRKRSKPRDIIEGDVDRETDFTSLQEEMKGERSKERLKIVTDLDPDYLARVMEGWLQEEKEKETLVEEEVLTE